MKVVSESKTIAIPIEDIVEKYHKEGWSISDAHVENGELIVELVHEAEEEAE